jgi:predicted AAA+ superfamily ATPase
MKPFVMCARPHRDIREGRFDLSVYAADLWSVFNGEGPEEYKNPQDFWNRTYITKGLRDLLDTVTKRLKGEGGDPVIQLQTPFGGGKTHSLIALYHRAREIKANVVVFVGTVFDPRDTRLWEEIERQLRGKVELLKGDVSPGRDNSLNISLF